MTRRAASADEDTAQENKAIVATDLAISHERRRADQFQLIAEIGRLITAILSVEDLLRQAPGLIRAAFGFYHVHIGLVEGDVVTFKAGHGRWWDDSECQVCVPDRPRLDDDKGIFAWVARHGHALVVPDIHNSPI